MKLEVGKKYVDREGFVHGPLVRDNVGDSEYPFGYQGHCWAPNGDWHRAGEYRLDLIAEYIEPTQTAQNADQASETMQLPKSGAEVIAAINDEQVAFEQFKPYADAAEAALAEVVRAKQLWPRNFASMHEGYSVIAEELNKELWEIVCQKQPNRDLTEARTEAIQVAAMAIRFAVEVCDEQNGRT